MSALTQTVATGGALADLPIHSSEGRVFTALGARALTCTPAAIGGAVATTFSIAAAKGGNPPIDGPTKDKSDKEWQQEINNEQMY